MKTVEFCVAPGVPLPLHCRYQEPSIDGMNPVKAEFKLTGGNGF